jgi:hypothetical protein
MYDFYLGTKEDIKNDEIKYLISVKRMMPRWVNSLPDTEFIALAKLLDKKGAEKGNDEQPVFVETGAGASSLAFAFYALKYNGIAFSWDLNSEKGSIIRTVCTETMGNYFGKHIDNHWKLIAFNSLSPYLGLPILNEMVDHVDLFFHDSEHIWTTIKQEIETIIPLLLDGSIVALDDANLTFMHTNLGYINIFRKKLGLKQAQWPDDNNCEPFYSETKTLLEKYFNIVESLNDVYKEGYKNDPYYEYYNAEFSFNKDAGAVRSEELDHRFDSWQIAKSK